MNNDMHEVNRTEVRTDTLTHTTNAADSRTTPVSEKSKLSAIKTLAILGFIAAIILGVWLAVMLVRFIPDAFSNLASLAESLSQKEEKVLALAIDKKVVNSGETFVIRWNDMGKAGSYQFSYSCIDDGVFAETKDESGAFMDIACGTWHTLPSGKESTSIIFTSEDERFVDIPFTLRYTPEGDGKIAKEASETLTIVNALISETPAPTTATTTVVAKPATTTTPVVTSKPVVKPAPVLYKKVPVYTTTYPVSNPNGFTDLAVSYIGVGTYNSSSRVFTSESSIDKDSRAALRFEVKNIGTKTSSDWTYVVDLPGGAEHRSSSQLSLKPQERAIITVLFDTDGVRTGSHDIDVRISGGNDSKSGNDSFSKSIRIQN